MSHISSMNEVQVQIDQILAATKMIMKLKIFSFYLWNLVIID